MENVLLSILTIFFYLTAAVMQVMRLYGHLENTRKWIILTVIVAIFLHAFLLYHWIDVAMGQNLAFFNVLSQVAWIIAVLVIIVGLLKPIENIGVFIYPFAAISIILALIIPGEHIINTAANPRQLVHILISFVAISVFILAASQAGLLAIQDRLLRHGSHFSIVRALPPIETMEALLFQIIGFGFVLLTLAIITSVIYFPNIFAAKLLQHTILGIFAWIVFAILLLGRRVFGWRGFVAIRWTLFGVGLLILSYFGSRLLTEFLL